jgi:hypothetical protein
MRIAQRGETVASLFRVPSPSLAVSCRRCFHRASIDLRRLGAHEHDRRAVVRLPVICRCGANAIEWIVLESPSEAEAFMSSPEARLLGGGWSARANRSGQSKALPLP